MCNFYWIVIRYIVICIIILYFYVIVLGKMILVLWYFGWRNILMDNEMINKGFKCFWFDKWVYKKFLKEIVEYCKFRVCVKFL